MKQGDWVSPVGGGCLMSVLAIVGWRVYRNNFGRSSPPNSGVTICCIWPGFRRGPASVTDLSSVHTTDFYVPLFSLFCSYFLSWHWLMLDFFQKGEMVAVASFSSAFISVALFSHQHKYYGLSSGGTLISSFSILRMSFMRPPYPSFLLNISIFR